jgi:pSer/pThr/pTyr-binding forkhead associated (FHA) protein/cell division protein FtsN
MSIILQDVFGKKYSLDKKLTIGSDSANRVVLLDSSSAPFHAEISLKKNAVQVKDLGSERGVYINNDRVSGTDTAYPGDTIWVGKVPFTVAELGPEEEKVTHFEEDPHAKSSDTPVTIQTPGYVDVDTKTPDSVIESSTAPVSETLQPVDVPSYEEAEPVPAVTSILPAAGKPLNLKLILAIAGAVLVLGIIGVIVIFSNIGANSDSPAELDLTDPALNTVFTGSFIQKQEDQYTGVGADGSPLAVKIAQQNMEQSTPAWSNYTQYQLVSNDTVKKATEFSIINNQVYKNASGSCSVFADTNTTHNPTNWPKTYLKSYVTGKARKVESGVTVNGVITDKYELKLENSPFAGSLTEMKAGELYRAQKGGYLVKLSITETWQADKWQGTSTYGFAAGKPVTVTNTVDFTYYLNGKLNVIVPGVCAGMIQPAQ